METEQHRFAETIRGLLRRVPFQPFRLKLTNQEEVDIRHPELVVVMKRDIFVAEASGDRFHLYALMHIVEIDAPQAA